MSRWLLSLRITFNKATCLWQTCLPFWISSSLLSVQVRMDKVAQTSYASQNHNSTEYSYAPTIFHRKLHSVLRGRHPWKCRFDRILTEYEEVFTSSQCNLFCLSPWHRVVWCPEARVMRLIKLFGKEFAFLCVFSAVWDKLTFLYVSWWRE